MSRVSKSLEQFEVYLLQLEQRINDQTESFMITWRRLYHRKGKGYWCSRISPQLRNNTILFCLAMSYWWEVGTPTPGPEIYAEPELVGLGLEVFRELRAKSMVRGLAKPSESWREAAEKLIAGWKPKGKLWTPL